VIASSHPIKSDMRYKKLEEDEMQRELITQSDSVTPSLHSNQDSVESNEEKLVAEAKGGSLLAFEKLVDRYEARVFRLAQTIAHSREDAEEIMQNAFAQAFKNLSQFRGDSRFYTWLVRITINEGLIMVRRRRLNEIYIDNSVETEEGILPRELEDWGPTPEQLYSQQELQDILATSIGQLSPGHRTVFQLRDVEGFSTRETAEALALSASAVRSRLRRARFQLRGALNKCFGSASHCGTVKDVFIRRQLKGVRRDFVT
jgi:RNA polymerase sigma-70 factor (ECF subfamily)